MSPVEQDGVIRAAEAMAVSDESVSSGVVARRWLADLAGASLGEDFLHRFSHAARVDPRTVRRWLAGEPAELDRDRLQRIAECTGSRLGQVQRLETDYRESCRRGISDQAWDASGAVAAALRVTGLDGGDSFIGARRPAFTPQDPTTRLTARWLTALPGHDWPDSTDIEFGLVQHAMALALARRQDDAVGGADWRSSARECLAFLAGLLAQHANSAHGPGRGLLGLFAGWAQWAGWCEWEAGHDQMAFQFWVAALRCGHVAGDDLAAVHVLASMVQQALIADRPADAVVLCSLASSRLMATGVAQEGAARRARALLLARHAVAAAQLSDREASADLLRQARALLDDLQAAAAFDNDLDWTYYVAPWLLDLHAGQAALRLGDAKQAIVLLQDAVEGMPEAMARNRAYGLVLLATARLAGPDPEVEQAVAGARQAAIAAETHVRSRLLLVALREFDQALAVHSAVVARAHRERFAAFCSPAVVPNSRIGSA